MDPLVALAAVVAVLLGAVAIGVVARRRDGRVRATRDDESAVTAEALGLEDAAFGERATLVQFSTEHCTRCPATRRVLGGIADTRHGVAHVDVDLTQRPDIARRFGVLQTPTTLIVDADRAVHARIGGAPRAQDVDDQLDRLLEETHA
ncbi:TlpA family protein disulfide reductase [Microbacterium marinilacus]|uniref:Thioredoxin domain-containing protein n=1 Tax=Microbacterium marinilacus TaxID=415209 RepID=A0ABP7BRY7_9MICO|nr:thioredoxin family protein [Microbacterium marinilacus]MBY0689854.1 thioredoxin family protein [Microbacterium marinilacus]